MKKFLFLLLLSHPSAAIFTQLNPQSEILVPGNEPGFSVDIVLIPFGAFNDNIGSMGQTETRKVITTASAYKSYFGHAAPPSVNFSTDWVVFYSAGTKNTGGYSASILKIYRSQTGLTLNVFTSLSSPGRGCLVTQALTRPFVLVKFKHPNPVPVYLKFYKDDTVRNCTNKIVYRLLF